jgi:hypothetical protein
MADENRLSKIEVIRRHSGKRGKLILEGTELEFGPIGIEDFIVLNDITSRMDKVNLSISKEDSKEMLTIFTSIFKASYPEMNDKEAEGFVIENFIRFSDMVIGLMPTDMTAEEKTIMDKRVKEAKELMEKRKA